MEDLLENTKRGAPPACLVLHGLGGGPYELGPLIDALKAVGLRVETPILPGHEPTSSRMPPSLWTDWAGTVEAAFDAMMNEYGEVAVIGFSTGATLALWLAGRRPVARMVLLAPFLAIRYAGLLPLRPHDYLRQVARVMPDLPRRPPAVRDPKMRRWAAGQAHFKTFSIPSTISALELIDEVTQNVHDIKIPILIMQGKLDTVIEPRNSAWLHERLGSVVKSLVDLPRSDHLLALDHDRERVISESIAFIKDGSLFSESD